ncbi:MAG: hypothetical protein IKN90_05295, partial [Treponema sp.]|nr:hypothetical protein [Treponema sp.]
MKNKIMGFVTIALVLVLASCSSMKQMFDLKGTVLGMNKPNIVSLLNSIELYKGKTLPVKKAKKLDMLKSMARRSGVVSSNQIGN